MTTPATRSAPPKDAPANGDDDGSSIPHHATHTNPLDAIVSRTAHAKTSAIAENLPLREILEGIGNGTYARQVAHVQAVLDKHGKGNEYRDAKKKLPAFIAAGTFTERNNESLIQHSGVVGFDYDDVVDLGAMREAVKRSPHVVYVFVSPSRIGLKIGVRMNPCADDAEHKRAWQAGAEHLSEVMGAAVSVDKGCKDVSRLCFVGHDPDLFVNEAATVLAVPPEPPELPILSYGSDLDYGKYANDRTTVNVSNNGATDADKARAALPRLAPSRADDYEDWLTVGMALKSAGCACEEWDTFSSQSAKYEAGACAEKWTGFKRDGVTVASLIAMANEDDPPKRRKKHARREGDKRLEIKVRDDDLTVRLAEGWKALEHYNDPTPRVFRFGGIVADIQRDVMGAPTIRHVRPDAMREIMANAAWWYRLKKDGESFVKEPVSPPGELIGPMLATPSDRLPVLTRIARAPMLTPSGAIHARDGYDPETRCWFALGGLSMPPVSNNPTQAEIEAARDFLLVELLGDFPFVEDGDRANALAMFLLPFVREIIDGPTPLHLIEKPLAGSGASLLASCHGIMARGDDVPFMTEGADEDEWRKRITSTLLAGPEVVVIDNLRRTLDSAALSSVLTLRVHTDRLLGKSENVELAVQCVWIATGNNPTTSSEIARRIVPIRLDPKTDAPTERSGFRHPKLTTWVRAARGQLLHAALTLAQAWHAAGRPEGSANLASYERYASVMGGILDVAGVSGFLANRATFKSRADVEGEIIRAFVEAWARYERQASVTASDLAKYADDLDFGNCTPNGWRIRFGKFLKGLEGRVFTFDGAALVVEAAGTINGSKAYRLTGSAGS